jgi:predicted RNA-binding Zn ribbon-like protein
VSHQFELVAGALCLDFVNTVGDRSGTWQYVRNYLERYEDLVSWGVQAHVLGLRENAALRALAFKRPEQAAAAYTRAVQLRETLHRLFQPIAARHQVARDALAPLNALLPPLFAKSRLAPTPHGCRWWFDAGSTGPDGISIFDRISWSVARSAVELLTSDQLGRVHQCELETCGWLFLDVSKNQTRRWCAMKMCGNKSKVRQYRASRKDGEPS